jgi:manganese/zinc/iron transport system ATP- binding protein
VSAEPAIQLRDVTVGYDRQPVLENITLSIPRGAFVGLLGANGSGKTTLLKTVAGILPPLGGTLEFFPPNSVTGYVPQRESLDSPFLLSCLEIVLMGLCGRVDPGKFLGRNERDWAIECLRQSGADDLARKRFAQLSGGQKQRVLIARALATRPDILLLDEPTAGIDPEATEAITSVLSRIHEGGKTIVMVNHDLPVISKVTEIVVWVRQREIATGPTEEMLKEVQLRLE